MNKTDLLFQMLEHPEDYSEAQWQDILADDECLKLYTLMAKTKCASVSPQVSNDDIDAEWQRLTQPLQNRPVVIPLWRKIAAVAAIVIALFGFSYAAVKTGFFGLQNNDKKPQEVLNEGAQMQSVEDATVNEHAAYSADSIADSRLYDNVPLEQMLNEISAYYHVNVEYRTDEVRSLRLYYRWEPDYSLDKVIEMLSHFETFNIHREGDKLIVESSTQEG